MRKVVRAEQKIKETKICKYKGCQKAFHRENMNPSTWKKKEYCTRGCQAEAYRTRKSGSNVLPFKKKGIKNTIDAAGIVDAANTFNKKFRKRTKTKCYELVQDVRNEHVMGCNG